MRLCPLKDETRLDLLLLVPSKGLSAKLVDWSVRVCEGCTQEAAVHCSISSNEGLVTGPRPGCTGITQGALKLLMAGTHSARLI